MKENYLEEDILEQIRSNKLNNIETNLESSKYVE